MTTGAVRTDVEAFLPAARAAQEKRPPQAYQEALRLYTGDPIPEDHDEDEVIAQRDRLSRLRVTLLVELAGVQEQAGELGAAIEALQQAVASDPLHEEAQGLRRTTEMVQQTSADSGTAEERNMRANAEYRFRLSGVLTELSATNFTIIPTIDTSDSKKDSKVILDYAEYRFKTSGVLAGLSAAAFTVLLRTDNNPQPLLKTAYLVATYNDVSRTLAAIALALATLAFAAVALSSHSVVRAHRKVENQNAIENMAKVVDRNDGNQNTIENMTHEVDGWITLGFLWLFAALFLVAFRINVVVGIVAILWTMVLMVSLPDSWKEMKDTLLNTQTNGPIDRIGLVCFVLATILLVIWICIMFYMYCLMHGGPQLLVD